MADHICARAAMLEQKLWDKEMSEAERAELEAHAADCAECAGVLQGLKAAQAGMATLRDEDIKVPSADAAWDKVAGQLAQQPKSWLRQQAGKLLAVAAAAVLVVGVGTYVSHTGDGGTMFLSSRNMFSNAVSTDADQAAPAAQGETWAKEFGMLQMTEVENQTNMQAEIYDGSPTRGEMPAAADTTMIRMEGRLHNSSDYTKSETIRYVVNDGVMESLPGDGPAEEEMTLAAATPAPSAPAVNAVRAAPAAGAGVPATVTNRDIRPYHPPHIDRPRPVEPEVERPVTQEPDDELVPLSQQKLEYAASMTLRVDDASATHKRVTGLVAESGGQLINSRVTSSEEGGANASLRVRVPSAKFDGFITSLHELGAVVTEDITALDRTRSVQAVARRLGDNEQTATEVKKRMAQVQGRRDTQRLERQLARLNSEREHLQQQQQVLTQQVDFATLDITLREDGDRPVTIGATSGFGAELRYAAARALNYCAEGFGIILIGLGVVLPWALLGWGIWWFVQRKRKSW